MPTDGTTHPIVWSGRVVPSLEPREGAVYPGCPFPTADLIGTHFVLVLLSRGPSQSHHAPITKWGPSLYEGLAFPVPAASLCGSNSCHTPCPAAHSVPATHGQTGLSFLWQPGCPRRAAAEDAHRLHPKSSRDHIRRGEERKGELEGTSKRTWQKDLGGEGLQFLPEASEG